MTGKRTALLLLLSASLGYGFHDLVNNGVFKFINRTQIISNKQNNETILGQSSSDQFMVKVTYDGKNFQPEPISIRSGNYIVVTNRSKTNLMWLESDLSGLKTTRGYGEGEQFQFMVKESGTFLIWDKLNPSASTRLFVQP